MAGELLGAVWPLLVAMAAVIGARAQGSRRRRALNLALHELRRPLQALALAPSAGRGAIEPGPLELALAALDDLDVAINGTRPALNRRPVAVRPIVESSLARWRALAARRGRRLELSWRAGRAVVMGDPARIAQALDNLLANAIEHGDGAVRVEAERRLAAVLVAVATGPGEDAAREPDPRRGHGLAVVRRVAAAHLGRFELRRSELGSTALLELPLAPTPLPAVPIEWASGRGPRGRPPRSRARPKPAAPTAA